MAYDKIPSRGKVDYYSGTGTKPTSAKVWSVLTDSSNGNEFEWDGTAWQQTGAAGSDHTLEQGQIGGERNSGSTTNNYDATHEEINKTFFNPDATTEQVISSVPCFFYGFVGKVGTGTLTIRDSSTAAGSATDFPVYTLAVGTHVDMPAGVRMESGLTLQCGTGTDEVTVFWRAI